MQSPRVRELSRSASVNISNLLVEFIFFATTLWQPFAS